MMTLKPARLLIALLATVALPVMAQTLATVNGKAIPASRAELIVKQQAAQGQADSPELRNAIKESLINREVLVQEAEKQGMAKNADVKLALENARQSIIVNAMMGSYLKKNPVTEADIKAEYDKFKAQASDKEYHARHILVKTDAEAKAIIAKLKAGSKFEDLAKQSLDTGSGANGGDLDWAPPTAYVKPFSDALVALKKGQFTETPVQSQFGFHVIRLEDTRAAKVPTIEEIKPQITESLQQRKLQAYAEQLRKKAVVK
jgi:peptidyl-prolyl cis-trans isomerase C